MRRLRGIVWACALLALCGSARAQSRGHGGGYHHHHGHKPPISPVTINPSPGGGGPVYPTLPPGLPVVIGGGGWVPFPVVVGPVAPTAFPAMPPLWQPAPDPLMMMPAIMPRPTPAPAAAARPRPRDNARVKELVELGDRLFRAGNLIRASERYEQALKANPDKAEPRVRLAQVALVRGKYQDAANRLREAQAAEPGWLATAGDLLKIFPEPAEFAKHVAKLETHLQARPEDRDAWLVLGALWYLSGQTQKAADVFLRLSDRKEDPTLRAFLEATKADRGRN